MKNVLFISCAGDAILNCIRNICSVMCFNSDLLIIENGDICKTYNKNPKTFYHNAHYDLNKDCYDDESVLHIKEFIISQSKKNNYDAIITCSGLYGVHKIMLQLEHLHSNWFVYMVDPYTYNINTVNKSIDEKRTEELSIVSHCRKIFCTPLMYTEYLQDKAFLEFEEKFIQVDLPLIIRIDEKYISNRDDSEIKMVFAGRLYPIIRKPDYLFSLMKKLPSNYKLYLYGSIPRRYSLEVKINPFLRNRIVINGSQRREELVKILGSADILVNIGNTVKNQLPSKLLEYFCFRKPILNVYSRKDCCTLAYSKEYQLCINIFVGDDLNTNVSKIKNMYINLKNQQLSFNEVQKVFRKNTPEYVGSIINSYL